jgi:hypothetical protein
MLKVRNWSKSWSSVGPTGSTPGATFATPRELGTIERVSSDGKLSIRLDSGREVRFNIREHAHIDHGYAVTSHSSQGQTAERALIHVDTEKSELLVNNCFAHVSV